MSHDPDNRGRINTRETIGLPNPIPIFDFHLKELDISYIPFFEERIKIEEAYIANLVGLHQKSKAEDSRFEQNSELTSLRKAWFEVRDNLDREAECRNAFVGALKADVLAPLITLRETQDRTRKRIKEEIKESTQNHTDFMENSLPRLKRNYLRKMQDVEEYKTSERPVILAPPPHMQAPQTQTQQNTSNVSPTSSSFTTNSNNYGGGVTPASPPRAPPINSPQPGYPLSSSTSNSAGSRPSTQPPYNSRTRSPSATTSLSDLAHHGKKALMGLLVDGPNRPGGVSTVNMRAKREADEADKEYRKAVHWLETLRLKRATTIRSGYTSIEDFIWEKGATVKGALENYMNCLMGTASSIGNVASHPAPNVRKISLEKDRAQQTRFLSRVDSALKQTLPQTLYVNHLVGESRDLIFGVSLVDYATERGLTGGPGIALGLAGVTKAVNKDGQGGSEKPSNEKERHKSASLLNWDDGVPKLIRKCVSEIESRGLHQEGIYRVSGRLAVVQELRHVVEKDEAAFEFNAQTDDIYCVASLLKLYLRELPEPVFRFPLQERIQHTEDRDEQIQSNFPILRNKMRRLPFVHQATLRMLIEHLSRIAARSQQNKMDAKNLAIVFGTPLFGEDDMPKGQDVLSISSWKDSVLEDMISYAGLLFDEKAPSTPPAAAGSNPINLTQSPPPPTPPRKEVEPSINTIDIPSPSVSYAESALSEHGSARTRVQELSGSSTPPPTSVGSASPTLASIRAEERARSPTPPPLPARTRGGDSLSPTSPKDFAPKLPNRPNFSIHPNARRGNGEENEEDSPGGSSTPVPLFDSQGDRITVVTPPPGWKEGVEDNIGYLRPASAASNSRGQDTNAGNNRSTGRGSPAPTS